MHVIYQYIYLKPTIYDAYIAKPLKKIMIDSCHIQNNLLLMHFILGETIKHFTMKFHLVLKHFLILVNFNIY